MSTPAQDVAWIRARAAKLTEDGMDGDDALTQATEERVDWKERTTQKRANAPRKPLRVSLADILKARKK